jgi:Predicted transcriptional regulators
LKRIEELREDRGWSTTKLAQESGISHSTINNLYKRNNEPSMPTLRKLIAAFGLSLEEFFVGENERIITDEQSAILDAWLQLTREQRKTLLTELVRTL